MMRMWSINVMILLLFCYACVSTSECKVYFESKNFFNVLHWDPTDHLSQEERYTVQYQRHGEALRAVKECQNITARYCDLTAFTPSLPDVYYIAHVSANGRPLGNTLRFRPLQHTVFSSPNLTIRTTATELHVNVTLPLGPNGVSIADIITKSKSRFPEVVFDYSLKIITPKRAEHEFKNTSGQFNIKLDSDQKYCGYVNYRPSYEWGRAGSENADFCETLPAKPPEFLQWILIGGVLLAALVIVTAVCVCRYLKIGKSKSIPPSLVNFPRTKDTLQSPDKNCIVSKMTINSESEKPIYQKKIRNPPVGTLGADGYSPQGITSPSWEDNTADTGSFRPASDPESSSSQSSVSYSAVVIQNPNKEDGDIRQAGDRTPMAVSDGCSPDDSRISPNPTSHGVSPLTNLCTVSDTGSQINVPIFRDANGTLVLSPLTFRFQSSTGDAAEGKPLLSDLLQSDGEPVLASLKILESSEWSDSGCGDSTFNTPTDLYSNTNYFPNTVFNPSLHREPQSGLPDGRALEPNYKPNWIPSDHSNPAQAEDCGSIHPWSWDDHGMEEEVGENEGTNEEEDLTEILLGNWKLQLQE